MLCFSCVSYPKKNGFTEIDSSSDTLINSYFSNSNKDYVYKANIEAFGNSFGGIFIVKKLGQNHHRIAFTTELGNKIFDFTFQGEEFIVNHIFKEMDRKILINILKNDFRVLVKEKPIIKKVFLSNENTLYQANIVGKNYFYFIKKEQLHKVIKAKNGNSQIEFLFSEINDDLAKYIEINHKNLRLSIGLKSI